MNAALSFLGLAKRAGRLVIGEESVKLEARANKTKLILTASDAGDSLKKRADNFARMAKCAHTTLPFSKDELGMLLGRGPPGILAITDNGMAKAFSEKLVKGEII